MSYEIYDAYETDTAPCENTDVYGARCGSPGKYYVDYGWYLCPDCAGDYDLPEDSP